MATEFRDKTFWDLEFHKKSRGWGRMGKQFNTLQLAKQQKEVYERVDGCCEWRVVRVYERVEVEAA
jgi:hypothetical protein